MINENSWWAVWHKDMEGPLCFDNHADAKTTVIGLAKGCHQQRVYLMKLESVGWAMQPLHLTLKGAMKDD